MNFIKKLLNTIRMFFSSQDGGFLIWVLKRVVFIPLVLGIFWSVDVFISKEHDSSTKTAPLKEEKTEIKRGRVKKRVQQSHLNVTEDFEPLDPFDNKKEKTNNKTRKKESRKRKSYAYKGPHLESRSVKRVSKREDNGVLIPARVISTPYVVPYGTYLECVLMSSIETNSFDRNTVEAVVIRPVWHNSKRLIPFGTRLYGTVSAGTYRDRATIDFFKMRFLDGTSVNIDGFAHDRDKSGAIKGLLVNEANRRILLQTAANFIAAVSSSLQNLKTNHITGIKEVSATSRSAILQGVSQMARDRADVINEQAELLKPYLLIPAGQFLYCFLNQELDVGHYLQKSRFTYTGIRREALWFSKEFG